MRTNSHSNQYEEKHSHLDLNNSRNFFCTPACLTMIMEIEITPEGLQVRECFQNSETKDFTHLTKLIAWLAEHCTKVVDVQYGQGNTSIQLMISTCVVGTMYL